MPEYEFMVQWESQNSKRPGSARMLLQSFFEAGCDDDTAHISGGVCYADFTRAAESYEAAVQSAIQQIESIPGLKVLKTWPLKEDVEPLNEDAFHIRRIERALEIARSATTSDPNTPDICITDDAFDSLRALKEALERLRKR